MGFKRSELEVKGLAKICKDCGKEKDLPQFSKDSSNKDKLSKRCRICNSSNYKRYYIKNKKTVSEKYKKYYIKNRDRLNQLCVEYNKKNKEKLREKKKEYERKSRDKIKEYYRNRYKSDPYYRFSNFIRSRISEILRLNQKSETTEKLIGCSISYLMKHLENKFLPGMTWQNRGRTGEVWHIDHRLPCHIFDLSKKQHQKICFHYTNLQPMWASDNLKKSGKVEEELKHLSDNIEKMTFKKYLQLITTLNNRS